MSYFSYLRYSNSFLALAVTITQRYVNSKAKICAYICRSTDMICLKNSNSFAAVKFNRNCYLTLRYRWCPRTSAVSMNVFKAKFIKVIVFKYFLYKSAWDVSMQGSKQSHVYKKQCFSRHIYGLIQLEKDCCDTFRHSPWHQWRALISVCFTLFR